MIKILTSDVIKIGRHVTIAWVILKGIQHRPLKLIKS